MADRAAAHGFEPSLPMRLPLLLAGLLSAANLVSAADAPPAPVPPAVENSVVKIFATQRPPDLVRPWSKASPREITGSGVVIEGKRILTNAHVVTYASQVQVQGNQSGEKVSATVEAIAIGIDLAVLKLEDESFFDTRPPLPRAKGLPGIKDSVMAYGYPTGGTSLSITKGIVSRIDFSPYNFPVSGLRIQIDAAINAGNSGGPALSNDQMIGVAFSRLGGGENIGYIIPNEEIELFLADIADGTYDGKPAAFDQLQPLQNPALRAFAQVPRATTGILVTEPDSDAPSYPLRR
jgi:S1-C subfamily serine protease